MQFAAIARELGVIGGCAGLMTLGAIMLHPQRNQVVPRWESWEVAPEEARGMGAEVLWLDARSEQEYARGHVSAALHVGGRERDALIEEVMRRYDGKEGIVIYGRWRDAAVMRLREELLDLGLDRVQVLRGSWRELR